jgi:hypothetical protein
MPPSDAGNDVTAYIVIEDFGQYGRAFRETDLAEADLGTIVRNMISGEYRNPMRVVAFNTSKGGPVMCPRKSPTMCSTGLTMPTQR